MAEHCGLCGEIGPIYRFYLPDGWAAYCRPEAVSSLETGGWAVPLCLECFRRVDALPAIHSPSVPLPHRVRTVLDELDTDLLVPEGAER